jgi:hypothetical protein
VDWTLSSREAALVDGGTGLSGSQFSLFSELSREVKTSYRVPGIRFQLRAFERFKRLMGRRVAGVVESQK